MLIPKKHGVNLPKTGMIGSLWISTPFWGSVMTMDTIGVLEFLLGVLASAICIVGSIYYIERVQLV